MNLPLKTRGVKLDQFGKCNFWGGFTNEILPVVEVVVQWKQIGTNLESK